MKDREFSKWLLSLGYLVLAIVILVNFIRQAPEGPRPRPVNLVAGRPDADLEQLKVQLEQERLLNRDLKNMLNEFQQAFGVVIDQKGGNLAEFALRSLEEVTQQGIPAISSNLSRNLEEKPSPFTPGKNPFLSFLPPPRKAGGPFVIGLPSEIQIRGDPRVPLLMQGSPAVGDMRQGDFHGPGKVTRPGGP